MRKKNFCNKNTLLSLCVLCFYAALSYLYFGIGVLNNITTVVAAKVNSGYKDPLSYIWALAWWPYAIHHHLNPFKTNYVWYPYHFNLAQSAMSPAIALLDLPITYYLGPIAAFNIQEIFNSALTAFTAFILCRYLSKKTLPAVMGGFIFGFSSYMIAHSLGHPNLTALYCIPLLVYLLLRVAQQTIQSTKFILFFTLLLSLQMLLSLEIFATFVLFGSITYLLAYFVFDQYQQRLMSSCKPILVSQFIAVILLSPYLYAYFSTPLSTYIYPNNIILANDLLSFIIPTHINIIGNSFASITNHFSGNIYSQDGYFGLGLLLILVLFAVEFWHTWRCRILVVMALITAIASLGSVLYIAGHPTCYAPAFILRFMPLLRFAIPSRFILYTTLCAAIMVSLWLTHSKIKRRYQYLLLSVSIILLLPSFNSHIRHWRSIPYTPAFFKQGYYKDYIRPQTVVMTLPILWKNNSLFWQAESHFYFHLTAAYVGIKPLSAQKWNTLLNFLLHYSIFPVQRIPISHKQLSKLAAFLVAHKVNVIMVTREFSMWQALLKSLGLVPVQVAGVQLYYLTKHMHVK